MRIPRLAHKSDPPAGIFEACPSVIQFIEFTKKSVRPAPLADSISCEMKFFAIDSKFFFEI